MSTNKGGRWEARRAAWAASPRAEAHAVNARVCFCEGQVSYRHRTFQNPGSNCQQGASEEGGEKWSFPHRPFCTCLVVLTVYTYHHPSNKSK